MQLGERLKGNSGDDANMLPQMSGESLIKVQKFWFASCDLTQLRRTSAWGEEKKTEEKRKKGKQEK